MQTPIVDSLSITTFLRHLEQDQHRSPATVRGYGEELDLLRRRAIPLEHDALARFLGEATNGTELAPTTRNRRLVIVRAFCRWLVREQLLDADPTAGIERARVPRQRRVALTPQDLAQVLRLLRTEPATWRRVRDEAILGLLFYTGLRLNELTRLQGDQVDLTHQLLRRVRRKGGHVSDVLLTVHATAFLRTWLQVRPTCAEPALFLNYALRRISGRAIEQRLQGLGERAGLAVRLHPHALRHAHATTLHTLDVSTELIRQSLFHSSLETTIHYLHGDEQLLRQALARLPPVG